MLVVSIHGIADLQMPGQYVHGFFPNPSGSRWPMDSRAAVQQVV
jgi:hypothetical protein